MESYPEDLLVGVFPLVFAVNAIFDPNNPNDEANDLGSGLGSASADSDNVPSSPKHRSDFDRFLDAMAGSLADEGDEAADSAHLEFPPIIQTETPISSRSASLFRPDEDEAESTDEDLLLDVDDDDYAGAMTGRGAKRGSAGSNPMRLYAGFGLTRRSLTGGMGANAHSSNNTSYAKALQQGQGFFQRARIVSISTKHGFPPSKDPDGTNNIVFDLKHARSSVHKAREIFTARPIQGILPAGWLEKHVHALPSVVLVVVKVTKANQSQQDSKLLETVESLHHSLVPKRICKIHVVGLVDDEIGSGHAQQWSLDISRQIVDSHLNPNIGQQESTHQITLLRAGKDLRSGTDGFPTSIALKCLHRSVRDSSMMYYLGQTRRTKEKLSKLSEGGKKRISGVRQRVQPPKELLPLAIRYCFKIAMYYEFQLKFEKSLKFMAEAYRHARIYYHHLIRLSTRGSDFSDDEDDLDTGFDRKAISTNTVSILTGDTEDMEVSITESTPTPGTSDDSRWTAGVPPPPSDMAHQCLAVADWLNFKLLQAGFGSHTEGGLLAADGQWRQHSRVFCARRFLGGHPMMSEEWYFWCHVAHQRLVLSQLVERHPPKALGDFGNEYDEVLFRCAPWRAYEAAAEAYLKASVHVQQALLGTNSRNDTSGEQHEARAPFVGGLDKDGIVPVLEKESKVDHKSKALELVMRAISIFEHEWGKEKVKDAEDPFPHRPWGRLGARLYYLAGGILLGMKRFAEASAHLENAAKHSLGWNGLESAVRRLLAECYEKNPPPSLAETENSLMRISSMVMDACFYAKMSPENLGRALQSCSSAVTTPSIYWSCECFDEFDSRLPFSFSVTFPNLTHAIAGDTVGASVWIRSNLDYAVSVESVSLLSMAGKIDVPRPDFSPASENLVFQARKELTFATHITLPKNLDEIAAEDGGADKHSKTSYTKSARPRTAAITSAAGSRLISEEFFRKEPRNANAQWSLNFLGGKPVRSDGIRIVLRLIAADGSNPTPAKPIELIMEKKKRAKTAANIKRTPFEEDNYIASAWCRPFEMQLPSGPRCLRVLGPMSDMEITNLSKPVCDGNVIEGTVNRICLKLQAGPAERCSDIKYSIKCSTTLVAKDGMTKTLTIESSPGENEIFVGDPGARAPALVVRGTRTNAADNVEYGYQPPAGWGFSGSGQESLPDARPKSTSLSGGESTFLCFELFRPSEVSATNFIGLKGEGQTTSICQTDFEITVSYRQERQHVDTAKRISENVTQKFSDSVVWATPIVATFSSQSRNGVPCGSCHPSNLTDEARPSDSSIFTNIPMIDCERISVASTLQSNRNVGDFALELVEVRFERDCDGPCRLTVASEGGNEQSGTLYRADKADPSRWLTKLSKFSLVYSVRAEMKNATRSMTFPLGNISVDWLPKITYLPEEARAVLDPEIVAHGPLVLESPVRIQFKGPLCYIEKAPFKTKFQCLPPVPNVAVPFEVSYSVTNDTDIHQRLVYALEAGPDPGHVQDILVCGLLGGDFRLAPYETKILSYSAVATKPGMTVLPALNLSSSRFNTWVVNERGENIRHLCVLP